MFDIRIVGGAVVDGAGTEARRADVGISGDRIEAVGDLARAEARMTIEAGGRIVCPGFIDVHSHSDTYILVEPSAQSKITQGVTTEVVGNCGASAAPRVGQCALPSDWREKHYPGPWSTVSEYRALLEQVRPAVNIVLLVGHNTLRGGVVGYDNRPATEDELRRMRELLERSLDEGARGFSTGLIYPPGMFAPKAEIEALAAVVARRGGVYASHMRNEGERVRTAVRETVDIGLRAGVRVQISHLKTSGQAAWGLLDDVFRLISDAQAAGADVVADRYPYTASCTDMDVVFPAWAQEGGRAAVLGRLASAADRARLREELIGSRPADYWSTVVVGSTHHAETRRFQGRPLTDAAAELGMTPADALLRIVERDELKTSAFFFGMSEENMFRILARPYVMIGSDASLRATTGPLSLDFPHPRAYGTFPRFLRLALDGKTVPLPEAVRKMTGLPASRFGLRDRGLIRQGFKADVLVFDPTLVGDTATFANPHSPARGIDDVIVNGTATIRKGRATGDRGGRFV